MNKTKSSKVIPVAMVICLLLVVALAVIIPVMPF